ncbi:MAG: protein kinase [Candidatus Eremiobacteraeota bacterium]|nr:protein kinase [Candidatus Eremiobacteraeota bacterium]
MDSSQGFSLEQIPKPWDQVVKWTLVGLVLIVFFKLIGHILKFSVMLAVAAAIGAAANQIVPRKIPYGWAGATCAGLLGAFLGSLILGDWGPSIQGIALVPGILGASAIAGGIHYKAVYDRGKMLEQLQAKADTSDPLLLKLVGDWRLVEMLGKGANARVYKALPNRSLDPAEAVAIKVLNPDSIEDEEFMVRYQREIEISKNLDNPYIVKLLGSGEQEGLHYITMELVKGDTLRSKITEDGLPIIEAASLMTQLMIAVEHAHSHNIIHRDIKPDNILMDGNKIKVSDFGLGRGVDDVSLTKTGTALGTPAYMAPEQIEGADVSPSCDQYAVGVVAYELFTGEKPFNDREPMRVLYKHLHEPPASPKELRPDMPESLAEIVLRMLEKTEEERFPTIKDALEETKKAMANYKPA